MKYLFLIFSFNFLYSQQVPKELTYTCAFKENKNKNTTVVLDNNCNHTSDYWLNNLKYLPNDNDDYISLKVNFIFLTKPDGTGNFEENNIEHNQVIDDIISQINYRLSHLIQPQDSSCLPLGFIDDTKIRVEVNKIWRVDSAWDFLTTGFVHSVPNNAYSNNGVLSAANYNGNYFYEYFNNDPSIPKGVNIVFANNGELYNRYVNGQYQDSFEGERWAMSQFPTPNNLNRGSNIIYPDFFNKYLWMKNVATKLYNEDWSVVRSWFIGSSKGFVHELGHSFWLYHDNQCSENYMSQVFAAHFSLKEMQIGKMYRSSSITNLRNFITENSYKNTELTIDEDEDWDLNFRLYSDLIIDNAELSLSCNLILPPQNNILVKDDSRLIMNGGELSLSDNNDNWEGIKIMDNSFLLIKPGTFINNDYFYAYTSNFLQRTNRSEMKSRKNINIDRSKMIINVFPNPFNDKLNISFTKNVIYNIQLFDKFGMNVYNKSNCKDVETLNLSKLEKGLYFLRVEYNKIISNKTIIKQ